MSNARAETETERDRERDIPSRLHAVSAEPDYQWDPRPTEPPRCPCVVS